MTPGQRHLAYHSKAGLCLLACDYTIIALCPVFQRIAMQQQIKQFRYALILLFARFKIAGLPPHAQRLCGARCTLCVNSPIVMKCENQH